MMLDMFRKLVLSGLCLLLPAMTLAGQPRYAVDAPPGQRLDVGGYKLHIHCQGRGSPTVILDAGVGGFSLEWLPVQRALSAHTRVCAYDRAGYGWSDMGPLPRTTARISDELQRLLAAAAVQPPYVLVGHSFGGYSVQHYARSNPDKVAGMVLIEASHPEQVERLPQYRQPRRPALGGRRVALLRQLRLHPNYPEPYEGLAYQLITTWKTAMTVHEEMEHFPRSAEQVRQAGELPDVPLLVLTRGLRVWPHTAYGDAMEFTWMALQDELAELDADAVHLIAEHSGHSIHMDEPGLVINAINTLLNRIDNEGIVARHGGQ